MCVLALLCGLINTGVVQCLNMNKRVWCTQFSVVHELHNHRRARFALRFYCRVRDQTGLAEVGVGHHQVHARLRRARDPHFGPVQRVVVAGLLRAALERERVRAAALLGQAEGAHGVGREHGQVLRLQLLGAEKLEQVVHERVLHVAAWEKHTKKGRDRGAKCATIRIHQHPLPTDMMK